VGMVPLSYRGRYVKFPLERNFNDWVIQVYASSNSSQDLRQIFTNWIQKINSGSNDIMNHTLVAKKWNIFYNDIFQKQSNSNYKNSVVMYNCFPIDISAMEMNNDTPDTFAEFTVTMSYDYTEHY